MNAPGHVVKRQFSSVPKVFVHWLTDYPCGSPITGILADRYPYHHLDPYSSARPHQTTGSAPSPCQQVSHCSRQQKDCPKGQRHGKSPFAPDLLIRIHSDSIFVLILFLDEGHGFISLERHNMIHVPLEVHNVLQRDLNEMWPAYHRRSTLGLTRPRNDASAFIV